MLPRGGAGPVSLAILVVATRVLPVAAAEDDELDAAAALAMLAGDEDDDEPPAIAAFELDVALGVLHRRFDYEEDRFQTLYAYELDAAPVVAVDVSWFPGSYRSSGHESWFGVAGHYEHGLPTEAGTSTSAARFGFVGRFPLGVATLAPRFEYGRHRFNVEPLDDGRMVVPPLDYEHLRLALAVDLRIERALLGFGVGQRFVMRAPAVESDAWWPDATAGGTDATIYVGWAPKTAVDLKLGVDVRRYYFDLDPSPEDPRARSNQVAGGAVDQYVNGWIGVAWHPHWYGGGQ
jgi:hypothetical protein